MLATLVYGGLRISELLALEWRDVDLAGGRLRVRRSKTDAGVREVALLPVLRDELATHKANAGSTAPHQLVFPSAAGTPQDRNRVRARVLAKAIEGADEALIAEGLVPLPEGLTLHALRRTFASLLVALGRDPRHVMDQLGHTDPKVTLGIYAKPMPEEHRDRLRTLVEGSYLPVAGSGAESGELVEVAERAPEPVNSGLARR